MTPCSDHISEQRLLGAIEVVCEIILKHGVKYAPLLDRLERELVEFKRIDDPINRARRHLARGKEQQPVI